MDRKTKLAIGVTTALVVAGIGTGVGVAASSGDDTPLQGSDYEQATAAALEHVGGGTVIETEVGDDGGAYGVEIRLEDGSVVEVTLDADFQVVNSTADDDGPNDQDSGEGDD